MNDLWVRYDAESGKIHAIGSEHNTELLGSYARIDFFTAKDFIEGTKRTADYIAVPNPGDPDSITLESTLEEKMDYDISKSIYQIEKGYFAEGENCVIQQYDTHWKISLSEDIRNMLKNNDYFKKKVYNLYFTQENDPNVLLASHQIKVSDLIDGDILIDSIDTSVCKRKDVSVFAYRLFDTYKHVVQE
tara:strand:+ start:692 stop:1258 length:567 start_codon:yes stop_codon:yes gene_type:complete